MEAKTIEPLALKRTSTRREAGGRGRQVEVDCMSAGKPEDGHDHVSDVLSTMLPWRSMIRFISLKYRSMTSLEGLGVETFS